jgi:tetratricopeptide (TPR) repeat protein
MAHTPTLAETSPAAVRAELDRVLAAPAFAGALAHQRLLRHLVEQTLAGQAQCLKETALALEVFMRPPGSFDPRRDSIVRVEARRLRERLGRHYAADSGGTLMISLPKGSYRPQWLPRAPDAARAQAEELVERGLYFLRHGHEDGSRKALARFEEAARTAPALAAAHSGVARAWLQLVVTHLEPPWPGIDLALAAVHRALALQPAHADSLVLAAQLTHRFALDWPAACALYERAARAAPASAFVRHAHALSLMLRGEFDAAEGELAQARQLDPLHLSLRAHAALLHLYRRQWAAAEEALRALLDMSPDNLLGMSLLAYVALCRGDAAAALVQYRQVGDRHPQLGIGAAGQAQALAALGQSAAARHVLARLHEQGRGLSPYQQAMVELRLGDADAALALLQRALDARDPDLLCLPVDPAFDALHAQPRFAALRRRVLGAGRGATPRPAAVAETSTP